MKIPAKRTEEREKQTERSVVDTGDLQTMEPGVEHAYEDQFSVCVCV